MFLEVKEKHDFLWGQNPVLKSNLVSVKVDFNKRR